MIKRTGLTRVDLAVAVACAGFVLVNVPVIFAGGRQRAKLEVCMANLRALTAAWSMYADSNVDKIVNGAAGCDRVGEPAWVGRCWSDNYAGGAQLPQPYQRAAIKSGALWPYLKNIGLYKCPNGHRGEMLTYAIVDSMNGYPRSPTVNMVIKNRTQIPRPQDSAKGPDKAGWGRPPGVGYA